MKNSLSDREKINLVGTLWKIFGRYSLENFRFDFRRRKYKPCELNEL